MVLQDRGYLAEVDYRMLTDGIDWDEMVKMMLVKDLQSET